MPSCKPENTSEKAESDLIRATTRIDVKVRDASTAETPTTLSEHSTSSPHARLSKATPKSSQVRVAIGVVLAVVALIALLAAALRTAPPAVICTGQAHCNFGTNAGATLHAETR